MGGERGGGVNAKERVSRFRCPPCKVGGQNKNTISLTYPMVTNLHLCNYCTKIFVIVVNTCVCRSSVDSKAAILSGADPDFEMGGGGVNFCKNVIEPKPG